MIFKRLFYIIGKIPLPNFLKRLRGYLYLYFFYGDWVGYESLIKVCIKERTMELPGVIIEIGSFVGGGTRKLAKYALQFKKRVYAIDIFKSSADLTACEKGIRMVDLYANYLQKLGLTMFEAYWFNVNKYPNVITIPKDSKKIKFPIKSTVLFWFHRWKSFA
jgi:hypothetical protein